MTVERRRFIQLVAGFLGGLFFLSRPAPLEAAHFRHKRKRAFHMYRWSGRGRRVSRAALAHAANRRYAIPWAARRDLPHPGANLELVRLDVSFREFARLFLSRRHLVVDLRHL
jgi:hypothetical protein